jgi:hypothetical protein
MWAQSESSSEVEDMDTSDMPVMTDYKTNPWHWFYLDTRGTWHMFEVAVSFVSLELISHYDVDLMSVPSGPSLTCLRLCFVL